MKFLVLTLFSLISSLSSETIFREDFRDDVEAHIPVTPEDLVAKFINLERLGPGADMLKLSYHPEIENDPHYVWNGECNGPTLLAFNFRTSLDLSAPDHHVQVGSKNIGKSKLHLALKVGKKWFVRKEALANQNEWNSQLLIINKSTWLTLNPKTIAIGEEKQTPNLKEVVAMGFVSPIKPNRSKDCTRLNWFELVQGPLPKTAKEATPIADPSTQKKSLPKNGFVEPQTPFLRSALVFEHEGKEHSVRRGVIVPLHYKNRWACFDPDTLRWVVVWEAPAGKAPFTYDSMAGVSFPDKKAKAKRAPRLVGEILLHGSQFTPWNAETAHNAGSWQGLHLTEEGVVLEFRTSESIRFRESVRSGPDFILERTRTKTLLDSSPPSNATECIRHEMLGERLVARLIPDPAPISLDPPTPSFPKSYSNNPVKSTSLAPFLVRNLSFPDTPRPIRATDIAFRKNGIAFLSTLDGDTWRIQGIEEKSSNWTRIATGIFEPIAIEVDAQDRLFTLGRDQITELIDTNGDGHIDYFRNASDAFQQTLHTRDYATSLAIAEDGSFYIAKGGLFEPEKKGIENELSEHRGTVLHITPDGKTATVLADGLRLPYVGLRSDGTVFASDQQGHYIPSSPLHILGKEKPFLGFEPTNFRKEKTPTPPLLWYPYQANRSSAAFCTTSAKAFPDLPNKFLQVSWNGRLFAIETPEKGQPFSWQLPLQLDFPSLNGAIHPQSGRLYLTGLGISGYLPTTPKFVGLASIQQNQAFPTPTALEISGDTVTITFNRPLADTESITPGHPTLRLFNIKRTPKYGSGHYRWDEEPGEHQFAPTEFQLSSDRQSFQATFATLRRSDLFDLQLNISTATSTFPIHLYTRPHHLPPATSSDLAQLTAAKAEPKLQPGDPNLGQPLFAQICASCHSLDGQKLTGPPLNGVANRLPKDKLLQSILDPTAEIAEGYEPAMPSFEGVIPPQNLQHLLSYLETLK